MTETIFNGCIPALMTPCDTNREPDFAALVRKGEKLIDTGMSAVVYCGSMGDWPLLTDAQRPALAVDHAAHAKRVGAKGLMVIPRVLSRGTSPAAQKAHFEAILEADGGLPAVIYNSPYYGFETKADLFFELRRAHSNLVGFKEFGGAAALRYAAEYITSGDDSLILMVGVDTNVFHGYVNCGARGAITRIGNVLPREVLHLVTLCKRAALGNAAAREDVQILDRALSVLSSFDEGTNLVLYYKYLMLLEGDLAYERHFNAKDALTDSQKAYAADQLALFKDWYADWALGRAPLSDAA